MKIRNVLTYIISALMVIVLICPLSPLMVKILYLVNFIFAAVIAGTSFFAGIRKSVPAIYSTLVLFFTTFTLVLFINTTRFVLLLEPGQQDLLLVSRVRNAVFAGHAVRGYIITVIVLSAVFAVVCTIKLKADESINGVIHYMKGTIIAEMIVFAAAVIACCFIGILKLDINFAEALKLYFPYCCSQIMLYMVPIFPVAVSLNLMQISDYNN